LKNAVILNQNRDEDRTLVLDISQNKIQSKHVVPKIMRQCYLTV